MNLKIKINKYLYLFIGLIGLGTIIACQPDDFGSGNGLGDSSVDASFSITPVDGEINRYILESQTSGVIASKWDVGDGVFDGKMNQKVFFPDMGTYTISHIAIGKGGLTNTTSQELVVLQNDPVAGNIVEGGKFIDTDDHDKWTIHTISDSGAEWKLNEGSATIFSTSAWAQQGIYQAIEVEKDKRYSIDMLVSAEGGFINTWFEVYAGTTEPVPGVEYKDNKIMGLSTWDGCATSAFSGKLSSVGCVKNSNSDAIDNTVSFNESGTIYLYIRSGGEVFDAAGITIRNFEMRGSE
ncbi:hypothetical protein FF125_07485 [Aureibaculum algae]|uniref:PKD domain-containing protein n=1 Tax=Aureibaculum algae TaxID=2584122 RepID=A0A5B7TPW3_9FLAO|nr:hypothetical protein [Aureibaculum algae]QCX38280.1 hypothetical protein FF125_07485 [Aureibaculum algae]